jgi:hypothetical protein
MCEIYCNCSLEIMVDQYSGISWQLKCDQTVQRALFLTNSVCFSFFSFLSLLILLLLCWEEGWWMCSCFFLLLLFCYWLPACCAFSCYSVNCICNFDFKDRLQVLNRERKIGAGSLWKCFYLFYFHMSLILLWKCRVFIKEKWKT